VICALSHGFNAITQTARPKKWSRDHALQFEDMEVVLAYDADQAGEKYATVYAVPHLARVVQSLRIIEWPDEMGKQVDGVWPEDHGEDLTDFFVKRRKTVDDFWKLINNAPPVDILKHISAQALEFFERGVNDRLSFKPRRLAEKILSENKFLSDPDTGLFYRWNGRFWETFSEDHIKSLAIIYLGAESQKNRAEDAAYQVRMLSNLPHGRGINDQKDWVCLKNGMLNCKTLELKPHHPEYFATFELNVFYNPDSNRKCDFWLKFMETNIQTPCAIAQLQEFFGYCLTKETLFDKCLLLIGPGSDGKSKCLKVLKELVGKENTSSIPFEGLEDQFQRAGLYQKSVNISTEIKSKAVESSLFKAITTGDSINAAFKFKNQFQFEPFCKLVFSGNKFPRVLDNSYGYFRRILPIQFKRQFNDDDPETDPYLFDKFQSELSEIFSWALVGLSRLLKNGRFTDCEETRVLMSGYRRLNNPVVCFVEDKCMIGNDYQESKKELFTGYKKYCDEGGYKSLSRENFFRELYAAVNDLKTTRPRINGKQEQYLKGISLNVFETEN
jgi:putative DNA primase/helicase